MPVCFRQNLNDVLTFEHVIAQYSITARTKYPVEIQIFGKIPKIEVQPAVVLLLTGVNY